MTTRRDACDVRKRNDSTRKSFQYTCYIVVNAKEYDKEKKMQSPLCFLDYFEFPIR